MSRLLDCFGLFRDNGKQTVVVKDPYALKGEVFTCPNGHEIAEFLVTVYVGDIQDVDNQIGNWRQTRVRPGELPICEQCGVEFCKGVLYFIDGKWRDPLNKLSLGY